MTDTKLQSLADAVRPYFKGARLKKFDASIEILQASLALGGWTPRGSVKASSGFYQGFAKVRRWDFGERQDLFDLSQCLNYGQAVESTPSNEDCKVMETKLSPEVIRAWVALCNHVTDAREDLDASRPVPQVTAIGLSPKVSATLKECNLDIDLPSIKPAKIDFVWVQARDKEGKLLFYKNHVRKNGQPVMVKEYFVAWSEGIKHRCSRFADGHHCEACGKAIPSRRYVPIEAVCKRLGLISMWLGCDCARNIFGIKDVGIDKNATPESVAQEAAP